LARGAFLFQQQEIPMQVSKLTPGAIALALLILSGTALATSTGSYDPASTPTSLNATQTDTMAASVSTKKELRHRIKALRQEIKSGKLSKAEKKKHHAAIRAARSELKRLKGSKTS
jgi:uncharacterized small protein (DUF1192 family)